MTASRLPMNRDLIATLAVAVVVEAQSPVRAAVIPHGVRAAMIAATIAATIVLHGVRAVSSMSASR